MGSKKLWKTGTKKSVCAIAKGNLRVTPLPFSDRQCLRNAIVAMMADARMPEPVLKLCVTIPQPVIGIPIYPLAGKRST